MAMTDWVPIVITPVWAPMGLPSCAPGIVRTAGWPSTITIRLLTTDDCCASATAERNARRAKRFRVIIAVDELHGPCGRSESNGHHGCAEDRKSPRRYCDST